MSRIPLAGRPPEWQVPSFELHEFAERRHRYCVIVFVLNEGERISRQLAKMERFSEFADIVIADGGSTDGATSPDAVRSLGVRTLLVKTGSGRLSAQMRMAFAYGLEAGYAGMITMDGNDKDTPDAIPAFVEALDAGWDHVQGSRFLPGGRHEHTPLARLLAIRLIHAPVVSWVAGTRYTDTTNGFRAYSSRLLLDPRVQPMRGVFQTYELHYYLAVRAAQLGYRTTEVPVTRRYPTVGPTPTRITPIHGNLSILRILWRVSRHAYDPE